MADRDPDFFKLHYRQWKRRMHKLRVAHDLQGALLCIVIETHLTAAPPADDDFVLAGVLMVSPRKARAAVVKLLALGLVRVEGGMIVDKTAVEDAAERSELRAIRAQAGHEGGVRSGKVRRARADLKEGSGGSASDKPLKSNETGEAHSQTTFELEKRREEKKKKREAKASTKKGARLPSDWCLPKQWGDWAIGEGLSDDAIRLEAANFADYWHSMPGQRALKADWLATWRRWCRKSVKDAVLKMNGRNRTYDGKSARERRAEDRLASNLSFARDLDRAIAGGS